ncbi:hypothetical protein D3C84_564000 [compost metagenome]
MHTQVCGHCCKLGGEHLAVAGLVVRQAQGTGEDIGDAAQGRFDAGDAGAVEHFIRHAGLLQDSDVLGGVVQLRLSAEQLGGAQSTAFVGNTGFGTQFVEAVAAVLGQADHALLVHGIAAGGAVAQHLRHPQVLVDIGGGLDGQRRVTLQQPLDRLERHARCSPGRGVAWRDLAGVGKAGFHGGGRLAVDHDHFIPFARQIIGTGGTDHTTTKHQNSHVQSLNAVNR